MALTLADFVSEATEGVLEFYVEARTVQERDSIFSVKPLARGSKHITGVFYCAGTITPVDPEGLVDELVDLYEEARRVPAHRALSCVCGVCCVPFFPIAGGCVGQGEPPRRIPTEASRHQHQGAIVRQSPTRFFG